MTVAYLGFHEAGQVEMPKASRPETPKALRARYRRRREGEVWGGGVPSPQKVGYPKNCEILFMKMVYFSEFYTL